MCGILPENGIIIPKGIGFLRKLLGLILEDVEDELTFLTEESLASYELPLNLIIMI